MDAAELADEFRVVAFAVGAALGHAETLPQYSSFTGMDWTLVLAAVRAHRIVAFVQGTLAATSIVPPEVKAELQRLAVGNARRNLALAAATYRVCSLLGEAGIRCLAVKGAVLSMQLYGDPVRRGAGDIDILVDPARFGDADKILLASGFRAVGARPADRLAKDAMMSRFRDLQYRDGAGHLVELHQRLTANAHRLLLDFEDLWRDREQVSIGGLVFSTLPSRVLPLYLCIHGAHHCWERLCWLADMAALLRDEPAAAAALADADRLGLGEAMRLSMALAHLLLGAPLPPSAAQQVPQARSFLRHFFAGRMAIGLPRRGTWLWFKREMRRRLYLYSIKPTWSHRWQEMRSDLENPIELQVLPLSPRMMFLYPLLRPLGWVMRNFFPK